jgi:hypothetical protein
VTQAVGDAHFGCDATHGIAGIDRVYFDPHDLSNHGEQENAERLMSIFSDLAVAWM